MKRCILAIGLLSLAACSSLHHDNTYLSARNGKMLVIHSPLTKEHLSRQYVLPGAKQTKAPNTEPPFLS